MLLLLYVCNGWNIKQCKLNVHDLFLVSILIDRQLLIPSKVRTIQSFLFCIPAGIVMKMMIITIPILIQVNTVIT